MDKKYTLITGASEGFGKSLAFECASRNMHLILVALPGIALHYLGDYIQRNYNVTVIVFEKDLSREEDCRALFYDVSCLHLEINMLINNAGLGCTVFFKDGDSRFYQQQIKLNVLATTLITHLFIGMLKKNGPAHILNVGSMSSFFYLANKQVYGGTKSYIYSFSKSLNSEVRMDGINVSVVCPGGMDTNIRITLFNKSLGWASRLSIMRPEIVASIAIDGLLRKEEVIVPGKMNKFILLLDFILPSALKKMIVARKMVKRGAVSVSDELSGFLSTP